MTFTKVALHLLTQMKKAKVNQRCKFRDEEGRKCAIGCLIPDELYEPEMDIKTSGPEGLLKHYPKLREVPALQTAVEFLRALQMVHDFSDPRDWKIQLLKVAHNYNLSTEGISQIGGSPSQP